jgi:DNA-binding beta-propeller fold protein YncE
MEPTFFHNQPVAYVATHEGGALYASDSIEQPSTVFRLVRDFGAGARCGGAAITPDDRFYVAALTGRNRVASFDVSDPFHPRAINSLRFDQDPDPDGSGKPRAGGPSGIAMSADGRRVAVTDYTVDTPGARLDGDRRVYMLRVDTKTGQLRFDDAFRDEHTKEIGVSFDRTKWPHGETGPARPRAVLFVTPEPPAE